MRYLPALLACVTAVVVADASCGAGADTRFAGGAGAASGPGNGGGTVTGSGGSSGDGLMLPDGGDAATCAAAVTCASQGFDCGMASDGCGGQLDCGTCAATQVCGLQGAPNVCVTPSCTPVTCASLGLSCGMAADGCGGTQQCGACTAPETCGGDPGQPGRCGDASQADAGCVPTTCAAQSANCGQVSDGCGGLTPSCGTCPTGETCGGSGIPSQCGAPNCAPRTCAQAGADCGQIADGCGGLTVSCGTCGGNQTCGGGGTPSRCGTPTACTGLCLQQQICPGAATTTITGTVYAPNGTDPLYSALVYIPNAPVQPFAPGVSCDTCGSTVTGAPLVSAVTGIDGTFTLTDVPVGSSIPLVIQNGRWRRQIVVPSVPACTSTALTAAQTRMPRTKAEGDIPLMGFVTGSVDALECVLRKIGIADSEFSDPSGTGRVRFYQGDGSTGATYSATTPLEDQLWGTQAAINQYDMVLFACQGDAYPKSAAAQQRVVAFANAGGRIFTTHYSYVWLYDDAPFSGTASWAVDPLGMNAFADDPGTGLINQSFPKGAALAKWLVDVGASSQLGSIPIATLRHDFTGVVAPSTLWISDVDEPNYPGAQVPMHYTFNTPVGAAAASQCGRVLYSDFHVEDAFTEGSTFPQECDGSAMTPQEKMLEFMLFDLGSCVTPDVPQCSPTTCAQQQVTCGPTGDGCGNVLQCGACPSGQTCGGGVSQCSVPACAPRTCAAQKIACGPAGDGCGNILQCGACASGTCGGGGTPGVCGSGTCTPSTCAAQHITCGPTGDGCGDLIQCGSCPTGETCGGGGSPGACGKPACTPRTCAQLAFTCGSANDGCGNIIDCGTCVAPQICGGAGVANVCGGGSGT